MPACSDANVRVDSSTFFTATRLNNPFNPRFDFWYQDNLYAIPASARSVTYDFTFTHSGDPVIISVFLGALAVTVHTGSSGSVTASIPFLPVPYVQAGKTAANTYGLVETAAAQTWPLTVYVYSDPSAPFPPTFSVTMTTITTTSLPGYGAVPPFGLLAVAPGATFTRRFQYAVGQVPHGNQPITTLIAYENAIDAIGIQSKYAYGPQNTLGDYYPMTYTAIGQPCLVMTVTVDNVGSDYPPKYGGTPIDHTGYRYWVFCPELSGNLTDLDAPQVWMVSEAFRVDKTGLGGGIPPPPPPTGIGINPGNHEDDAWNYHSTQNSLSSVYYRRSGFDKPGSPGVTFDTSSSVPASDPKTLQAWDGHVFRDRSERLWLLYCESKPDMSAPNVRYVTSDDDGKTWSTPTVAIPGGKHPAIAIQKDECFNIVVKAAFVAGTKPNVGTIQATSRAAGETVDSDVFTFMDGASKPLSVVDDTFGIAHSAMSSGLWLLHCIISGDGSTSHWYSADECRTWTKVG